MHIAIVEDDPATRAQLAEYVTFGKMCDLER